MNAFQDANPAWATLASLVQDMQRDRLLRLHFPHNDAPADATLLANTLDAAESLSCDFCYIVEVLSDNAAIALESVMGKMVCIELVREDGSLRYFNGHVFEFRFLRTDGGFACYEMVLEPWLAHLHLRQNNKAFHGLSVAALTDTVLEDYLMRDYRLAAGGLDPAITYICTTKATITCCTATGNSWAGTTAMSTATMAIPCGCRTTVPAAKLLMATSTACPSSTTQAARKTMASTNGAACAAWRQPR